MWSFALVVGLCCTGQVSSSDRTPRTVGSKELTLVVTPAVIYDGLTKNLDIHCAFSPQPGSDFNIITSMILSKTSDSADKSKYQELAAVSQVSRQDVTVKESLGAQVSGQLPVTGTSYIHFIWTYPGHQTTGQYRCQLFGMDSFGHPLVTSATANITENSDDHNMYHDAILGKFKELETALDNKTSELNDQINNQMIKLNDHEDKLQEQTAKLNEQEQKLQDQATQLGDKQTQLDNLKSQLDDQSIELSDLKLQVAESRDALMVSSSSFRGHHYYLSYPVWRNVPLYDSLCRLYGGYLAEIDDQQELDFIHSFMENNSMHVSHRVFIGGTRVGSSSSWIYQRSGEAVTFFNWSPSQPRNDIGFDCLLVYPLHESKFETWNCYDDDWHRFLCELPH